jgi:hypothetical protein
MSRMVRQVARNVGPVQDVLHGCNDKRTAYGMDNG